MMERLTEENFVLFAARHYDNKSMCYCTEEFEEDLSRVKYIRRLLTRYKESGELRERLLLNHMIVLFNTFGGAAIKLLLLRNEEHWSVIFPFLEYLGWLPPYIQGVGPHDTIATSSIAQDPIVVSTLASL